MKKILGIALTVIVCLTLAVLGFVFSPVSLTDNQLKTFYILLIICACSASYCFIVGQITGNTSQMDKLWSILPIVYLWICCIRSGFQPRLIIMSLLVTLWGARLTYNFAKKGAYSIKFWSGKEDYRWEILRKTKPFNNKIIWAIFNLGFISIYQNVLILAFCLPAVACMEPSDNLNFMDIIPSVMTFAFFMLELIADHQQRNFYNKRSELTKDGAKLEDILPPYNKGFNTSGLWKYSRHPNYLGEQGMWISLYLFVISSKLAVNGIFHWSMAGCLFLVLLFLGSSTMSEGISSSKYPMYKEYQRTTSKFFLLPNKK